MKKYEIIFMSHIKNNKQLIQIVQKYKNKLKKNNGNLIKIENWGNRQLSCPIKNIYKANYILMNIWCDKKLLKELNELLKYNDIILRSFIKKII